MRRKPNCIDDGRSLETSATGSQYEPDRTSRTVKRHVTLQDRSRAPLATGFSELSLAGETVKPSARESWAAGACCPQSGDDALQTLRVESAVVQPAGPAA